jgi:hypothetical protein
MATAKEREEFIAAMVREFPDKHEHAVTQLARLLLRHAKTHGRLAEESCNDHPAQGSPTMDAKTIGRLQDRWDARIERQEKQVERRMAEIAAELGATADFGGDPRGYTVKLRLPSGRNNTWGQDGFGVPQ